MLDSELITLLGNEIDAAVKVSYPLMTDYEVMQGAQPTQEGTPSVPTLILLKVHDRPRGWPMTSYARNSDGLFQESLVQLVETTCNVSSLFWQDPTKPDDQVVTAADLLNSVMLQFLFPSKIQELMAKGINILRITDVSNEPFENDDHRFEFHPTFEIVFTHNRTAAKTTPFISTIDGEVIPVN